MRSILSILFVLILSFCFAQNTLKLQQSGAPYLNNYSNSNNFRFKILTDSSNYYSNTFSKYNTQWSSNVITGIDSDFLYNPNFNTFILSDSTQTKEKWYKTDTGISLLVSGGLITAGTIMHFNDDFKIKSRDEINRYLPDFENRIDDYTQFIPYAAAFALDFAGIKSQHNTKRKLVTTATALGLNLLVVQSLKYSIAEPRPDGSSNNAFPSGHTTTAFMGAHIFHKEYKHRSPFYSIAGYALASFTGVFRQLNNRHWISDVTAGAGLGIGLTELAYFLNDGWWKEKGINEIEETTRVINESKPSFIGVKIGYSTLTNNSGENEPGIEADDGYRFSFEGAYFFNKYLGLGTEIGFQSLPTSIAPELQQLFNVAGYEILPQSAGNRFYYFGPYFQLPFGKNAIGTKLHAGFITGPSSKIFVRELGDYDLDDDPPEEYIYADYDPRSSFSWSTGIYISRVISNSLSVGIYADYNWADLKYEVTYMDEFNNGNPTYFPRESKMANYDSFALGANLNILLW